MRMRAHDTAQVLAWLARGELIMTDNGIAYRSHDLRNAWPARACGICAPRPLRRANGKAARFLQTVMQE